MPKPPTKEQLPLLKWSQIAKLVNQILDARTLTMRAFADEVSADETQASRWIRATPPQEPRRKNFIKIIKWIGEHFHFLNNHKSK